MARQAGRPRLGVTKKLSLTLEPHEWEKFDKAADNNRSAYLRDLVLGSKESAFLKDEETFLKYVRFSLNELNYSQEQIEDVILQLKNDFETITPDEL